MLIDTDVLIWALRGYPKAVKLIMNREGLATSIISYMELLQGAKDRNEQRLIKRFLVDAHIQMLPTSDNIGHRAAIYLEEYGLNSSLCLADAMIAATAIENETPLCTGNRKHFKQIKELTIVTYRP